MHAGAVLIRAAAVAAPVPVAPSAGSIRPVLLPGEESALGGGRLRGSGRARAFPDLPRPPRPCESATGLNQTHHLCDIPTSMDLVPPKPQVLECWAPTSQ